jgi:UrcA family protein
MDNRRLEMNTIGKSSLNVAALATAAILAGVAGASPAFSAEPNRPSVSVRVDDLDLSRPADRATLEVRLKVAARRVCGSPTARQIEDIVARRECFAEVIAQGHTQLESAERTASLR